LQALRSGIRSIPAIFDLAAIGANRTLGTPG
jgi:hypothetical protein